MWNNLFIFSSLFSYVFLTFMPMTKKNYDFGDNVCHYKDNSIEYVRPCPGGQYCQSTELNNKELYTCQPSIKLKKTLGDKCSNSAECEGDLRCETWHVTMQEICRYKENYYFKKNNYYYCLDNEYLYSINSTNNVQCYSSLPVSATEDVYKNMYYWAYTEGYYFIPGPYKVAGIMHFLYSDPDYIVGIDKAYIGSIEVGNIVGDYKACKSGFAIKTYSNGRIDREDGYKNLYYKCAEVKEVDESSSSGCIIKYIDKQGGEEKLLYSSKHQYFDPQCPYLKIKLDMFKQYMDTLGPMLEECESKKNYDEPLTCGNDELRKLMYFYDYPDIYALYKDNDVILDYLLQAKYHNYTIKSRNEEDGKNTSFYSYLSMNIKYLFFLLIILLI